MRSLRAHHSLGERNLLLLGLQEEMGQCQCFLFRCAPVGTRWAPTTEPWAVPLTLLTWNNKIGAQLPQCGSNATFHIQDPVMDVCTI